MKSLLAVFVVALASMSIVSAQDKQSQELQVLNRFVGKWQESVVTKPSAGNPNRTSYSANSTRKWILNDTTIENKGTWSSNGTEFLHLMTYDAESKKYLQWYFDKNTRRPMTTTGTWNATKQSFTFTGTTETGMSSTSEVKFHGDDKFTWTHVMKNKNGSVLIDMEATAVRVE